MSLVLFLFRATSKQKGVVFVRQAAFDEEKAVNICKPGVSLPGDDSELPDEISPPGLSPARQWYLYEHVRGLCSSRLAGDIVCPKPSVPKSSKK